jgi:heterotetrameric sarcosine oxidase delta subunit
MLLLSCPYCGPRSETEFHCGGDSHLSRPPLDCSDEEWAAYLFFHGNASTIVHERWRHSYGCGSWFNIARDPLTHAILATYAMGGPKPSLALPNNSQRTATDKYASRG